MKCSQCSCVVSTSCRIPRYRPTREDSSLTNHNTHHAARITPPWAYALARVPVEVAVAAHRPGFSTGGDEVPTHVAPTLKTRIGVVPRESSTPRGSHPRVCSGVCSVTHRGERAPPRLHPRRCSSPSGPAARHFSVNHRGCTSRAREALVPLSVYRAAVLAAGAETEGCAAALTRGARLHAFAAIVWGAISSCLRRPARFSKRAAWREYE